MNTRFLTVSALILVFVCVGIQAQNALPEKKASEILESADYCFKEGIWDRAIRSYRILLDKFSEDPLVQARKDQIEINLLFAEFNRDFEPSAELLAGIFKGRIVSFIPKADVIELEYTFEDPEEIADFNFARIGAGGLQSGQNTNVQFKGAGKYASFATLKALPFQVPWQVEMVVQEQGGNPDTPPDLNTPRQGVYLRFGDENAENGYFYGLDVNYHDGRMSAPHGILKFHPGGLHKWDYLTSDFSPRLVPFQEMEVKVICHTNGDMCIKLADRTILRTRHDDYKKGFFHFGPQQVVFKRIRIKAKIEEEKFAFLLSEIREKAWAQRLADFRKDKGIAPPERAVEFPALPEDEARHLIDFHPAPAPAAPAAAGEPLEESGETFSVPAGPFGVRPPAFQVDEGEMDGWGVPAEDEDATDFPAETPPAEEPEAPPPVIEVETPPDVPLPPAVDSPLYLTYCEGLRLRIEGKLQAALDKFSEVIGYNGTSVPALYERSYCNYLLGNDDACLADIKVITDLQLSFEALQFLQTRILTDRGAVDEALAACTAITEESPFYPSACMFRGWLTYLKRDIDGADKLLDTAARLDPKLTGAVAWYRDRIDAFRNGPRWIEDHSAASKTNTVHTGVSDKAARLIGKIVDGMYTDCGQNFGFLKRKEDRRADRELQPVTIFHFATEAGLINYLDRIVIGREKLQSGTGIVYDAEYHRVYFYSRMDDDEFLECVATIGVMTYLRNLKHEFPAWFEHGLSFYFENSLIETSGKGMFNLQSSQVEEVLFSSSKQQDLMRYYLYLTGKYTFPITFKLKGKDVTLNPVVPVRTQIIAPGTFPGVTELFGMSDEAFAANLENNKTEAGLFIYFLLKYRKGFYREFISTYFKGDLAGKTPEEIMTQSFAPGYIDRMLKIMDWYILNFWHTKICNSAEIPPSALFGAEFEKTMN